jgi:hypothetical protein
MSDGYVEATESDLVKAVSGCIADDIFETRGVSFGRYRNKAQINLCSGRTSRQEFMKCVRLAQIRRTVLKLSSTLTWSDFTCIKC